MDAIQWSPTGTRLPEFYEKYQTTLPQIVRVTAGYCGQDMWETLSTGEMLRIHAVAEQERILVKDFHKRYFSIPVNYPVHFRFKGDTRDVKGRPLQQLLVERHPPFQMEVAANDTSINFHIRSHPRKIFMLGVVNVEHSYQERYLKGNIIRQASLHPTVLLLPTYVPAVVSVAVGSAAGGDLWQRLNDQWTRTASRLNYTRVTPSPEINVYSTRDVESSGATYDTIEPSTYVSLKRQVLEGKVDDTSMYTALVPTPKSDPPPDYDDACKTEQKSERHNATRYLVGRDGAAAQDAAGGKVLPTRESITPRPSVKNNLAEHNTIHALAIDRQVTPGPVVAPKTLTLPPPTLPPKSYKSLASVEQAVLASKPDTGTYAIPENYGRHPRAAPDQHPPGGPRCGRTPTIKSMDQIPEDINGLSDDELGDCLALLNMSMYIDTFKEQQINGSLLSVMEEVHFTDMNVSPMHARKLIMFSKRGWRPK